MGAIVTGGRGAPFFPSGMNKATVTSAPTSWAKVTSWSADTGSYPGSSVVSDGLVVQSDKAGALVSASATLKCAAAGGTTAQIRVKVGTTVVATSASTSVPGFGGTAVLTCSGPADVLTGQHVTMECQSGLNTTVELASTWVRVTES